MTALAAANLGCETAVIDRAPDGPATAVTPRSQTGNWNDPEILKKFGAEVDVITLENEFVDSGALAALEQAGGLVFPGSATLALTQDKLLQKQTLQAANLAVPRFCPVQSPAEIAQAGEQFGWPIVLKTRRNGYDGKGNATIRSPKEVPAAWEKLGGGRAALMVEAFVRFRKELAVIVTRGRDGESVVYPVVETIQEDHICRVVRAPAEVQSPVASEARFLALRAIEAVRGVGSFGVELFLTESSGILVNELAPRVHNSGHYTIEACLCSQFENHVRAVLGWPLGATDLVRPAAVMINLLGEGRGSGRPEGLAEALRIPGVHVHVYGKAESQPGRKMGHLTALGDTVTEAFARAEQAARLIRFGEIYEQEPAADHRHRHGQRLGLAHHGGGL